MDLAVCMLKWIHSARLMRRGSGQTQACALDLALSKHGMEQQLPARLPGLLARQLQAAGWMGSLESLYFALQLFILIVYLFLL